MVRRLIQGIRNIIRWTPIIWDDHDWDYHHLLAVMKFKLERMAEDAVQWNTERSQTKQAQMKQAALILDRLMTDWYLHQAFEIHEARWGTPEHFSRPYKPNPEYREWVVKYPNAKTQEDEDEAGKQLTDLLHAMSMVEEMEIHRLMHELSHVREWWD